VNGGRREALAYAQAEVQHYWSTRNGTAQLRPLQTVALRHEDLKNMLAAAHYAGRLAERDLRVVLIDPTGNV
jgi:hypothetical protein